jgi:phenolic acid decarboxylase
LITTRVESGEGETVMEQKESFESTKPDELERFIGKHFIYTYDNGWRYELYIKNALTIDYRIHSGMVGGRWVRNQQAHIVRISAEVVKISWDEPTGTAVSLAFNMAEFQVHGVIFFPCWVALNPEKTICFQNEHLDEMSRLRDLGPTYPKLVIDEFAVITFVEDCGKDNETVIACAPGELPSGFADRRN